MDWIRRNWPDMLIGIALVAVIAGIVMTLMSGGSFLPLGQNANSSSPRPTASTPATGTTPAPTDGNGVQPIAPGGATGVVTVPGNATAPGTTDATTQATTPDVAAETTPQPASPTVEAVAPQPAATAPAATAPAATTPAPTTPAATTPAPAATTPQASPAAPAPASTTAATGPTTYRVGVGAFRDPANAQRRAEQFRNEGYPVLTGTQGENTIVLVGPFSSRAEADTARDRIRSSGLEPEARVFEFTPEDAAATATTTATTSAPAATAPAATSPAPAATAPVTTTTTTTGTATGTATPAPTAPPATGGRRYLQVAAYANQETARPQIERLQDMGYNVTQRQSGNLIRVLIGPFSSDDLGAARERMAGIGIPDAFPVD